MTDISSYTIKNPYIQKEHVIENRIPKILHNIWLPGYDKIDQLAKELHMNIKKINPEWEFMIWDESSILGVLKKYPEMNFLYMNCSNLTGAVLTSTCKAEIAKYVILKEYGGIYFDFEYQCTKPFDSLVSFTPDSNSSYSPVFVTYDSKDTLEYIFSFGIEKYSSSWIAVSKNHPVWDSIFSNLKKSSNKYELFEAWNQTLKKIEKENKISIKVIGEELKRGCKYLPNEMTMKTHTPCSSMYENYNENGNFLLYIWSYIKCHYKQLLLLVVCFLIIIGIHHLNDFNSRSFSQPSFPGMPGFGAPPPPQQTNVSPVQKPKLSRKIVSLKRRGKK